MASLAGKKRKVDYGGPSTSAQARKRQKGRSDRNIITQTADAALSTSGELNIASFVKSREFEIAALDQGMKKSRKSLNQRAFQQLPRHMRRRTASHNVNKIPKRLRSRATREIVEDNTPTGTARKRKPATKLRLRLETAKRLQQLNRNRKRARQKKLEVKHNAKESDPEKHISLTRVPKIRKNSLAAPPQATSKFKKRQVNKTWLPTHMWHAKRAHMTRPTLPLWRMAIPLRPTEKSYRPTHRAAGSRGCVAWDTSYMSTVSCVGTENALEHMLRALGFTTENLTGTKQRKWKAGARFAEGWATERNKPNSPIAPILVLWQVKPSTLEQQDAHSTHAMDVDQSQGQEKAPRKKTKLDRRLWIRVHPSAFHQCWQELIKVAKMQRPQVLLEDLRFEIGSITLHGPGSSEALQGILKPAVGQKHIEELWRILPLLTNPASLPQNAVVPLDVLDPRHNHPPKRVSIPYDQKEVFKANELVVSWPLDQRPLPSRLFDHKERYRVSVSLPTQKAINRGRATALAGQEVQQFDKDRKIPVLLYAHRAANKVTGNTGSWTLLLPWSCVDLVWRSLMYLPLNSGSTPLFGGLDQTRQVAFEQTLPWYPGDYPGVAAGKAWDITESGKRFDAWLRRPTSKRFAWDALDLGLNRKGELGRGWACDWEYLLGDTGWSSRKSWAGTDSSIGNVDRMPLLTQRQRKRAAAKAATEAEQQARRRNTSSAESEDELEESFADVKYDQLTSHQASALLNVQRKASLPVDPALATVRIRYLTRGTPKPAARIYRLPSIAHTAANAEANIKSTKKGEKEVAVQPAEQDGAPSVGSLPPTPLLFSTTTAKPWIESSLGLRKRWLRRDPNPTDANPASSTQLPVDSRKEHRNHHDDPVSHRVYDKKHTKDLSHIRVFPPHETKPQVLNIFGPRPPAKTPEDIMKVLQPQLVPNIIVNQNGDLVEEDMWDKHVPCPDAEDLIGFVTTGGYSLAEGRGMAIGSIWTQRLVEGWRDEDSTLTSGEEHKEQNDTMSEIQWGKQDQQAGTTAKAKANNREVQKAREEKRRQKQAYRERHLCIVRNAGESVGRLAIWEVC